MLGNQTLATALVDEQDACEPPRADIRDKVYLVATPTEFRKFESMPSRTTGLEEIVDVLKPTEAYFKLSVIGRSTFALFADKIGTTRYKIPITTTELEHSIEVLRETIAVNQGGYITPHAFDVALARKLFIDLMGPVANRIAAIKHIIFQPDRALLGLPLTLLITDGGGDETDFRSVRWLGRCRSVSMIASAEAFVAARKALATSATQHVELGRGNLERYRFIHFATHGLVTSTHAGYSARPALLTSFHGADWGGLLSFKEIFDLKINADIVILQRCKGALSSDSENTLDELVRTIIAAGGRTILASQWPVSDDFNATKQVISGLLKAKCGTSIGESLCEAQRLVMDDARTSHPYFWASFVVIGDASLPVFPKGE